MKRICAVASILALVLLLGLMLGYLSDAEVSLVSDSVPAISIGGRE